jgi:hypothetical protein
MLNGSGKSDTTGNARGAPHRPHGQSEDESQEDGAWAQRSGRGSDDERKDAEDEVC